MAFTGDRSQVVQLDPGKFQDKSTGNYWAGTNWDDAHDYGKDSTFGEKPTTTPPPSTGGTIPAAPPPPNNNYQSPSSSSNPMLQGVNSDLYTQLLNRAHQGTAIDPNTDPNIRSQADPYSASVEREKRNYLADMAEKSGPNANLQGEARMANEKAGQASGLFESQLVGKELQSKRDEIQQALTQLGSQLTADQSLGLQKELGYLNNALGLYGIDSNANLGKYGIDSQAGTSRYGIDTNAGLTQQQINSNNDQFNANFGLNSTNQASYWDAVRRGLI